MNSFAHICFGRLILGIVACRPHLAWTTTRATAENQSSKTGERNRYSRIVDRTERGLQAKMPYSNRPKLVHT